MGRNEKASRRLLSPIDPPAARTINPAGASPFLLIGDHAGRAFPQRLGTLGLAAADLDRHIAWDIGIADLGAELAGRLDACFIAQAYSRLVIDCNRVPGAEGSIAAASDGTVIPGNADLSADEIAARQIEIYQPYQECIAAEIAARRAMGKPVLLFSLHSFTPVFQAFARPWRFGVLHLNDSAFSRTMLNVIGADEGVLVGDNEPYRMEGTDNTIPLHVSRTGVDYLELETRQDLIATPEGVRTIAALLENWLNKGLAKLLRQTL